MAPVPDDPSDPNSSMVDNSSTNNVPEVIEFSSDSDSDFGDFNGNIGYTPLAQGPDDNPAAISDSDSQSDADEDSSDTNNSDQKPKHNDMPKEQVDTIKAVMANIKLPSIPNWAKSIPEEAWMAPLIKTMELRKETSAGGESSSACNVDCPQSDSTTNFADFDSHFSTSHST